MTRNSNGASQIWEINGIESTPPDLTLLKIINGATIASDSNVSQRTFILTKNGVVELRIHGADMFSGLFLFLALNKRWEFSGHAFDIVQSASGPPNYVNPFFVKPRPKDDSGPSPQRERPGCSRHRTALHEDRTMMACSSSYTSICALSHREEALAAEAGQSVRGKRSPSSCSVTAYACVCAVSRRDKALATDAGSLAPLHYLAPAPQSHVHRRAST
ncbi:hypothetical protein B0H14DRAFT_2597159 [Mycena olivaceomarginata]|nr:hypothetical protein B0H14DRAFT_2597159 [Mycena olivaceomarginata]